MRTVFPVFGLKQEYSLVDNILESCGLSYDLEFMDWYVFGEEKMADEVSDRTGETEGIIAGGFALATLIMSDQVTALHPLFGVPLFLYLIRDFKRPCSCCNRIIVSLTMSFVTLLFTCYPIDLILAHYGMAQSWDIILAIQCFFVSIFIFAVKAKFELRTKRGEA